MWKPYMAAVIVCLVLSGVNWAQDQGSQNAGNCGGIIDAANKSGTSERTEDQIKALSRYKEAIDCLGPALTQLKAETLMKYSRSENILDQYPQALENLQNALKILEKLPDQNAEVQTDEAKVYGNLGYAWKMLGQLDQALDKFEEARERFEGLGDIHFTAYSYQQLGLVHSLRGDYKDALDSYEQALKMCDLIAADTDSQQQKAAVLDLQGRVYMQLNKLPEASAKYREALKLAREKHYEKFIVLTLNDIGALKLKQNQGGPAEFWHRQALKELQDRGIADTSLAETQALLADALTAQKKYGLALKNYNLALERQKKTTEIIGLAQTYLGFGMLESAERHWRLAEDSFLLAAKFYDGVSQVGESTARFRYAMAFAAQGNDTAAGLEIQKAIALAEKVRRFVPGGGSESLLLHHSGANVPV
jgi:tetratricopeptide (TPR) repeat protein